MSRHNGKVKWFNDGKGYGFIESPDFPADIFVHHLQINGDGFKSLSEGQSVTFNIHSDANGLRALSVTAEPEA